jgi:hypothetical protein
MFAYAFALLLRQTPLNLIDQVRQAVAVSATKPWSETVLTGSAEYYGEPAKYSLKFTPDGNYLQSLSGPLGETFGFDGKSAWQTDHSGAPRIVEFSDADNQVGLMLLMTGRWLETDAPVELTAQGNQVAMKLKGTHFVEVVDIDPTSHLPFGATFSDASGKVVIAMSDWHVAGAKRIPFKVSVTAGGITDTFAATKAKSGSPSPAAYSMPVWKPNDIRFDATKLPAVETRRAATGHVLVHPLVNGKDVGWFILDSGAEVMVIDPAAADTLSLPKTGKLQLVGVGGSQTANFRIARDFTLGPATLKGVTFTEFDLKGLSQFFRVPVAGIVGYSFFRRTIISLDLAKPSVEISNPEKFTLPSGSWLPLRFSSANPVVEARFEGNRTALFRLDTGANGTVTFHAPYVEKEKLLEGRKTGGAMSGGVGGMTATRIGTLEWFELGGHRFEKPIAAFSQAKSGAFVDDYLAGNIGQDFMLPFTTVFDFGGSRVAFLPLAPKT